MLVAAGTLAPARRIDADFASPAASDCVIFALRAEISFPDRLNRRGEGQHGGVLLHFSDLRTGAVSASGRARSRACPGGQLAASPVISAATRWWIADSAARLSRPQYRFGVNE